MVSIVPVTYTKYPLGIFLGGYYVILWYMEIRLSGWLAVFSFFFFFFSVWFFGALLSVLSLSPPPLPLSYCVFFFSFVED